MSEENTGAVLVAMSAVRQQVEAGEDASFDVVVTNEGDETLYAVDVELSPAGGTVSNLPEGATADGGVVRIEEIPAGETLHLSYQVPTAAQADEDTQIEGGATATGWYDQAQGDSVTASTSAGVGVTKPSATRRQRLGRRPGPAAVAGIRSSVLISGLAAPGRFRGHRADRAWRESAGSEVLTTRHIK